MPLKSNEDGSYMASWVPSTSGNYIIQVFIDGKCAGLYSTAAYIDSYFMLVIGDWTKPTSRQIIYSLP